jgi:hypothetical protein
MDKTAQRRGAGAKLHEAVSPGRVLSRFFDPQFKEVWESLVKKDNTLRSVLEGQKLDKNVMPGVTFDKEQAKGLLSKAKSYLNQREFISAVSTLSAFHRKMQDAINVIDSLNEDVSKVHHEFLFGKKVPDKKYMERLHDFEQRIASQHSEIIKQAGLIDSLKNLFTERGRALKSWEKRYEDRVKPFREGVTKLLDSSTMLFSTVMEHLKTMGSLRASRKIDAYIEEAKKIKQAFMPYDKEFRAFYNSTIKPWVEAERKKQEEMAKAYLPTPGAAPAGPTTENVPPLSGAFQPPPGAGQTGTTLPGVGGPGTREMRPPAVPEIPDTGITNPVPAPEEEIGYKSNQVFDDIVREQQERAKARDEAAKQAGLPPTQSSGNFLESLQSLGQEDPKVLAVYISKYARSIQGDDPETAIQLFKIAKSLRG